MKLDADAKPGSLAEARNKDIQALAQAIDEGDPVQKQGISPSRNDAELTLQGNDRSSFGDVQPNARRALVWLAYLPG